MAKLTAAQTEVAKLWLNDLFQAAGIVSETSDVRDSGYWLLHKSGYPKVKENAKIIIDTLMLRKFDNVDRSFDYLAGFPFGFDREADSVGKKSGEMLARYVAWFCNKAKIYWDNSLLSAEEMDEFLKTYLGRALDEYGCFASSPDAVPKSFASKGTKATPVASAPSGVGPKVGYKSTGARSEDVPNLIGTPHEKINLSGSVYCIIADKTGKNLPNAFITPLKPEGAVLAKDRAEKVNMGSGNGYTDCTCWFDNSVDADAFCMKCREKFGSKFTGITVGRKTSDSNGYFEVSTEFGPTFIKASKLNEEILFGNGPVEESVDEANNSIEESAGGYEISAEDYLNLFKNNLHRD